MDQFDLVVIGSGPGGHAASGTAARLGARVAVIEKDQWGGTCTNSGCVPTKALLACSGALNDLKRMKRLGISLRDAVSLDFASVKKHQTQIVRTSALGVQKSLKDAGVALFQGEGHIISATEVEVISKGETRRVLTKNIVIAWGSEPACLPGIPLSDHVLDSNRFLALNELPRNAVIVGAGNIGVEFATLLAEFGCAVSLIELMDQILPLEDSEAAAFLERELKKLGVDVLTSTSLHSIMEEKEGVRVRISSRGAVTEIESEYAVICTGRNPLLLESELERTGIKYSRKGISTDENFMTSVPGIFAIGDVAGGILLAHRASKQGKALASFLFGDGSVKYIEAAVPTVTYSHPNLARVGLTEAEALEHGLEVEVVRSEYGANIMARAMLAANGFAKFLFHKELLVGATILGEQAAELIAPMGLAIANSLHKPDLKRWIIAHPTLSEILAGA